MGRTIFYSWQNDLDHRSHRYFIEKCLSYSKRLPVEVTNNSPEFADPILFKIMCATFIRHSYFYVKEDGKIYVNEPKVQKLNRAASPLLGARDVKILNGQTLSRKVDDVLG